MRQRGHQWVSSEKQVVNHEPAKRESVTLKHGFQLVTIGFNQTASRWATSTGLRGKSATEKKRTLTVAKQAK